MSVDTTKVKVGLAEMLKGGVIMDVINASKRAWLRLRGLSPLWL